MISEKHLELFEPLNEVSIQDRHGPGGLLIARKFSDEEFPMDEKTAAMIDKKETLAKVNPH
jgi:hypothetical protein